MHFLDDGISGVTMDRPGFVDMIQQLEQGKAAAVFVKDLSRLGRNYIEVGRLTEEFFPEHDIRLVAVSDNIDTAEGDNELAPIRNLFNEWYARDISKKRRISNKIKGNAGEPMGQPPYGYMKDPDNPKRWIVDDEAVQVVKHIYGMTLDGMGTEQIAAQLEREEILTPRAYWLKKGVKRPGKGKQQPPTKWNSSTVTKILSLQEYCGDILNFKTYSKSYKNKKRIENDRENWVVFKDVHEPIIDRAVWELVQQKRGKVRKRRTNEGEKNMFSGLLVCADCGNNLHFHFNQGNPEIRYFNCSNYKGNRGTCTSKKTCELLRTKGISAQFSLVGSGARNMITRNGDGPYDLDYNLLIMKAEERYRNDLRLLKETVRNALNRAERREFFSDAQDSTSCLTALLHFKDTPNVEFSFDVAITTKNKNGNYMRLIHNKNVYALGLDQYTWNEVPNSHQVKDRADKLKRAGLWQKVRDRYLEKKNMYLFRQDHNHPSFVVYVEAVNEVYSRYFNRGGGYSVQSIF